MANEKQFKLGTRFVATRGVQEYRFPDPERSSQPAGERSAPAIWRMAHSSTTAPAAS